MESVFVGLLIGPGKKEALIVVKASGFSVEV